MKFMEDPDMSRRRQLTSTNIDHGAALSFENNCLKAVDAQEVVRREPHEVQSISEGSTTDIGDDSGASCLVSFAVLAQREDEDVVVPERPPHEQKDDTEEISRLVESTQGYSPLAEGEELGASFLEVEGQPLDDTSNLAERLKVSSVPNHPSGVDPNSDDEREAYADRMENLIGEASELVSDDPSDDGYRRPKRSPIHNRLAPLTSHDIDQDRPHLSRIARDVDWGRLAKLVSKDFHSSSVADDESIKPHAALSSLHGDDSDNDKSARRSGEVPNPAEDKNRSVDRTERLKDDYRREIMQKSASTCSQASLDLEEVFTERRSLSPSRSSRRMSNEPTSTRMSNEEPRNRRNSVSHPVSMNHSIVNFVQAVGDFNRRASLRHGSGPTLGTPSFSIPNALRGDESDGPTSGNSVTGNEEELAQSRSKYERDWFDLAVEAIVGDNEDDPAVAEARRFSELVSSGIHTIEEAINLLRRTRAVTLLANRLMLAEDEVACFEIAHRLLHALFGVESSSACLMIDRTHYTFVEFKAVKDKSSGNTFFEFNESGRKLPVAGTAVGKCRDTLDVVYTPDASKSYFNDHVRLAAAGLKTLLNAPILVAGRKFAGTLNMGKRDTDAFSEHDRILVTDISTTLGAHVFSKRLQIAERESHKVSQELLHSIIPEQVLSKIEHYWRDEDGFMRPPTRRGSGRGSMTMMMKAHDSDSHERFESIRGQLGKLKNLSRQDSQNDLMGALHRMEGTVLAGDETSCRALFAEEKKHVSVIFTDIVGFSKISMDVPPLKVMDMLQDLFNRFDWLCEHHDVLKLETIGDAYLCAVGIFEDDNDLDNGRMAALRALDMAKDMVREAQHTVAARRDDSLAPMEYLQIRVGIHVGDITYGVLGQHLPKLSVFGHGVNMAARMEQTSEPGKIHVSKDFKELIGDWETNWEEPRVVPVKNMGEVQTFLLDPSLDPTRNY
jgi:class 3 adenylate cyclase/GTP-sensing pleiotropic transcriptional regulator CodY